MAINLKKFNEVVAAAKSKAAGNARWINAIDKAADAIIIGRFHRRDDRERQNLLCKWALSVRGVSRRYALQASRGGKID
jgi:hypothetical protein